MTEPDLYDILLRAFFPNGIAPHQYGNLTVLMFDIRELYGLYDQIARTEKNNGGNIICRDGATRQDEALRSAAEAKKEVTKEAIQSTSEVAIKPLQNTPKVSSEPFISGTYPANFEEVPIKPVQETKPKRMGRPPRTPGSLGIKCPKCGSDDVVAGGYGPKGERRIKCKACDSQPTIEVNRPLFNDRIDERILALEFEDLSFDEISERLKADGASIPASDIEARLVELHSVQGATA